MFLTLINKFLQQLELSRPSLKTKTMIRTTKIMASTYGIPKRFFKTMAFESV